MVCDRCKLVVRREIAQLGLHPTSVQLGEVELTEELSVSQKQTLSNVLEPLGFSLIDDKKSRIIERVKTLIVQLVHEQNNTLQTNLSDYLSHELNQDYTTISHVFSEVEGITIEKFFIAQKIERVKELLVYDELTLSEIAYQLHYSSVAHLSNQFKKVTGLTPSHFKHIGAIRRKGLDEV